MNIIFMGTPDFAVPCLESLMRDGQTVTAVFTQPDKPKGRGYHFVPPPVKVCAEAHAIPVYQPATLKDGTALSLLQNLSPDLIVVVAYGKILPKEILTLPKYGRPIGERHPSSGRFLTDRQPPVSRPCSWTLDWIRAIC